MSSEGTNHGDGGFVVNQLKITDLIEDCLEEIFLYLDYDHLITIAHTNKGLKSAAQNAFKSKFGKTLFRLHIDRPNRRPKVAENFNIYQLKTWLRLLRCFGHLIAELKIGTYKPEYRHPNPNLRQNLNLAFRYTKEFCSNSLNKISLYHIPEDVFDLFDPVIITPFPKVEAVNMLACNLAERNTNFNA